MAMRHKSLFAFFMLLIAMAELGVHVVEGRVVISEIMYAPRVYEDWFEFIEIHNTGPETVSLGGWSLPST